jgi:hypothetical protein
VALREADLGALGHPKADGGFPDLTDLLGSLVEDLRSLSDVITYFYFSHAQQRVG